MTLRISGGELRSRAVKTPRAAAVRPTPGKVKEALFSILGSRIEGKRVLDLYAGSGAVGFEAVSRGAAHVTFVEIHAPTALTIKKTAERLGLTKKISVVCAPAETAAKRVGGHFGFVYADPPYAAPPPHLTFGTLRSRGAIDPETIIVYEHRDTSPSFGSPGFTTTREARYGETVLQFLKADALKAGA